MATAAEFTVEVRDINFVRQGQIAPEYLDLKMTEVFNSVGAWELKLPAEHPLLPVLKTKGSGIIVTRIGSTSPPFSGRMQSCVLSQDAEDPKGTWVIAGVDDNVIAAASLVYPDPANIASAQAAAYWTPTGTGENVMKQAVQKNIGSLGITSRKYAWLTTATDLGRGATVNASARFDAMGDFLTAMATRAGLGWRFYQYGTGVTFDVFVPSDKSSLVRLDIRNGGIESTELGYSAPSATEVLVLGQGEGVARKVRPVSTTASLAEAVSWGLRWEQAKDERNTNVDTELQQAGEEVLTEQGATVNSMTVVPSDAPNQKLGIDWGLGDSVTILIDNSPATAVVKEIATYISSEGVVRQATVGDPVGFDWEAKVSSNIKDISGRLADLEAGVNQSVTDDTGWVTPTLTSSWVSVSGNPVQYRRLRGVVYIRGAASGGTAVAMFTLPPSCRPGTDSRFIAINGTAATTDFRTVTISASTGIVAAATGWTPNLSTTPPFIADN